MKFLAPAGPRLALLLVTFAQPLLVNRTIDFVTSDNSDTQGWALGGAFACVYALIAVTTSLYWEKVSPVMLFCTHTRMTYQSLVGL